MRVIAIGGSDAGISAALRAGELDPDRVVGDWDRRHGHFRSLAELDVGYRILTVELPAA